MPAVTPAANTMLPSLTTRSSPQMRRARQQVHRRPMGRGPAPFEQPGRAANQRPGADRKQGSSPAACPRIQASTSSSSITASWPKPPGTCSRSSCGASASTASAAGAGRECPAPARWSCRNPVGRIGDAREHLEGPVKSIWSSPSNNNEPIWRWVSGAIMRTPPLVGNGQRQYRMVGCGGNDKYPSFPDQSRRGWSSCSAYPAVQLLDVAGPLQVFASANELAAKQARRRSMRRAWYRRPLRS